MLTNENPESEEGGLLFSRFRSHLYSSSVSSLCLFKTQPSKSILYPKEGQPLLDVCVVVVQRCFSIFYSISPVLVSSESSELSR